MRRGLILLILVALACPVLSATGASAQEEREVFSLSGYFQAQYGLFVDGNYHRRTDEDGFPTDHGDFAGKASIMRNVLQLDADWRPADMIRVHATFRGARSGALLADRYAQDPDITADLKYNDDETIQQEKISYVQKTYYTENDLREIYVDVDAGSRVNFRIGRQQVSWGDMGSNRLLDVVNPVNGSWHLPLFESFEDTRIPLYMAKFMLDIPEANGALEAVLIPMIDDPENTVNPPATFYGAWGLPLAPRQANPTTLRIDKKICVYPKTDFSDAHVGARWKGSVGGLTYSFVAFHGHMISPPIPDYVIKSGTSDSDGYNPATVYLKFPRQNTYGFTANYSFGAPINAVLKLETALNPDKTYPVNSFLTAGVWPDDRDTRSWKPIDPNAAAGQSRLQAPFYSETRHELSYGLEFFRMNDIKFVNPTSQIISVFRVLQYFYFKPDDINNKEFKLGTPFVDETLPDGTKIKREDWWILNIPGYDSSIANPMVTNLVFSTFTSYFHGSFTPGFTVVVIPRYKTVIKESGDVFDSEAFKKGSGFMTLNAKFALGDHWRLETGYNRIWGDDPYYDLGLFRDRDEVYGKVRVQF